MGYSQRQTASGTGLSRDTVRKYIAAAKELGVSQEGPAATEEQLSKLAALSWTGSQKKATPAEEKLESWGDQIYQWVTVDRLQLTRIQELLAPAGLRCVLHVAAAIPATAQLAAAQPQNGADGEHPARGSGGAGLRPPGLHPGPGERPQAGGVGPAGGAGLLQAQLPVAHLRPEAGGCDRRPGGRLGLLRRHSKIPGHRQLFPPPWPEPTPCTPG